MIKTTTTSAVESEYPNYDYYEYEADIYKKIYNVSTYFNLYLEIFTVLVNVFHLWILTRKELRSIAIYIIMIGICMCDIINFLLDFYSAAVEVSWLPQVFPSAPDGWCLRDDYLEVNPYLQAVGTLTNVTRHTSVWLAILMALIRTLSVMFPMSNWIQKMTKSRSAIFTVLLVLLFWLVYSTWQFAFYRVFWLPDNLNRMCQHMPKNTTQPRYVFAVPAFMPYLMNDLGFVEGIVKILPAIFYPILTVSLILELRTIKRRRQNMKRNDGDKSSDHTTKLILFMTITFLLSEGLSGIHAFLLYNRDAIEKWSEDLLYWVLTAEYPIINLKTINAASHAFVCFLMSSQYRDVVKSMFCESHICKRKRQRVLRVEETRSTSLTSKSKSY